MLDRVIDYGMFKDFGVPSPRSATVKTATGRDILRPRSPSIPRPLHSLEATAHRFQERVSYLSKGCKAQQILS